MEKESELILAQKIISMHLLDNFYENFFTAKVKKIINYKIGGRSLTMLTRGGR